MADLAGKNIAGASQIRSGLIPRVLVVDDLHEVRQIHTRYLKSFGMEVVTAENGTAALEAVRCTVPDVIVTDLDMPGMSGLDLCRCLRADPATSGIAVVILTGDASIWEQAALDAGCDAVLWKPCTRALLLATIRQLLERRGWDPQP